MRPAGLPPVAAGPLRYGKTAICLVEVDRRTAGERARQLTARVSLTGGIDEAYLDGDNARMVTTDALADIVQERFGQLPGAAPETMALEAVAALADRYPYLPDVAVSLEVRPLEALGGAGHAHAATTSELAAVTARRRGGTVRCRARLRGVSLLRTSGNRFDGFVVDAYTTTRPAADRAIGGDLEAWWEASPGDRQVDWVALRAGVRRALLAAFATDDSASVQHLALLMARRALAEVPALEVVDVTLATDRLSPRPPPVQSPVPPPVRGPVQGPVQGEAGAGGPAAQLLGLATAPRGTVRARLRRQAPDPAADPAAPADGPPGARSPR